MIFCLTSNNLFAKESSQENLPSPKVVYGDDNRIDYYQVENNQYREVMDSTVSLVTTDNIEKLPNGLRLKSRSLGSYLSLCQGESFAQQPSSAFCSGFLVGEDLVATAGHCVSIRDCKNKAVVFGFQYRRPEQDPTAIEAHDVYTCAEVVANELTGAQDYALIRLDRPVKGYRPLALSRRPAEAGGDLFVIGHPSGIPAKLAGGAKVRMSTQGYFKANLDTFGGNSGSAVFDAQSLEVLGILVRGERDYRYDSSQQCNRVNRCPSEGCAGEDVTHIDYILKALARIGH